MDHPVLLRRPSKAEDAALKRWRTSSRSIWGLVVDGAFNSPGNWPLMWQGDMVHMVFGTVRIIDSELVSHGSSC